MSQPKKVIKMWKLFIVMLGLFSLSDTAHAEESFGVCNREIDKAKQDIQADYEQWVAAVKDLPVEVRDAYTKIFTYNRDQANLEADKGKEECYAGLRPVQEIVNQIVELYTGGLSKSLPEKMTRVDISEIMAGKPLGGPNAAVPQVREFLFNSLGMKKDNPGTVGNTIRDPWKCITGQRKC
jgi:hypothetical protein